MAEKNYQWEAAFVAYCNNCEVSEISHIFNIPLETLQNKITTKHWAALRNKLPLVSQAETTEAALAIREAGNASNLPAVTQARLKEIEDNRRANLKIWLDLRDHAAEVVAKLKAGTLKLEKHWNNKGSIISKEIEPTTGDLVNLASYTKQITDGTYAALGDVRSAGKGDSGAHIGPAGQPPAQITLILPGVIGAPREQRAQVIDNQQPVVDVDAQKVKPDGE